MEYILVRFLTHSKERQELLYSVCGICLCIQNNNNNTVSSSIIISHIYIRL